MFLFICSCQSEVKEDLIKQKAVMDSIDREIERINREINKEKREIYKIIISRDSLINN
jgi:hypothetical protein